MNSKIVLDAMDAVYQELMEMPREEFLKELARHEDGDIATILRCTGAFKTREVEALAFSGKGAGCKYETTLDLSMVVQPYIYQSYAANREYSQEDKKSGFSPVDNVTTSFTIFYNSVVLCAA